MQIVCFGFCEVATLVLDIPSLCSAHFGLVSNGHTDTDALTAVLGVVVPESLQKLVEHGDRLLLGRLRDVVDHGQTGVFYPELGQQARHAASKRGRCDDKGGHVSRISTLSDTMHNVWINFISY